MEKGLAIITGADGGMGQVITAALAKEGYPVIMASIRKKPSPYAPGSSKKPVTLRSKCGKSISLPSHP